MVNRLLCFANVCIICSYQRAIIRDRKSHRFFAMPNYSATAQLEKLIGGPWPVINPADLGFDHHTNILSQLEIEKNEKNFIIYRIQLNSWHLDFETTQASGKDQYVLKPFSGYLLVPQQGTAPFNGLIARHQSKWQYQYGANEVMGLAGDNEDKLQNLLPFALKHNCIMLCTDSPGYGSHPLCLNRTVNDLAQVESCYDRLLQVYGKCYLWQVINDIKANIAFLDLLAEQAYVKGDNYFGIGHSMGAQQLLAAAPFVKKLMHIFANDGFTTMQYLASHFASVLHGPSLMIPNIVQYGDNLLILAALAEKNINTILSCGENDLGNPHEIVNKAVQEIKRKYISCNIQQFIHPGSHQLSQEALEYFGQHLQNSLENSNQFVL